MVKMAFVAAISAVIIALGPVCRSDEMAGNYKIETVDGTVTMVDVGGSKLKIHSVGDMTFPIANNTSVKDLSYNDEAAYDIRLSDIGEGDYVSVEYYRDGKGGIRTVSVRLKYDKSKNQGYYPSY